MLISNTKGTMASQHAGVHDADADPRPGRSTAEDVPMTLPSIHVSKGRRDAKGGGEAMDHEREREDVETNLNMRIEAASAEQVRQKRPQTAATKPKLLRFAPESYRPQSAAVTPTRAQQLLHKHL